MIHKTGYQIAYLRNWLPCFIFAMAPCCIKCISYFCSISRQTTSVHCIGGRSKANMSWIFLKIPAGNLLEICLMKFADALLQLCYSFMFFLPQVHFCCCWCMTSVQLRKCSTIGILSDCCTFCSVLIWFWFCLFCEVLVWNWRTVCLL